MLKIKNDLIRFSTDYEVEKLYYGLAHVYKKHLRLNKIQYIDFNFNALTVEEKRKEIMKVF